MHELLYLKRPRNLELVSVLYQAKSSAAVFSATNIH